MKSGDRARILFAKIKKKENSKEGMVFAWEVGGMMDVVLLVVGGAKGTCKLGSRG